ncbi:hypothetical protein DVV91_09935 [Clostridium botulinum]|uniref:hypothetical protein n=1 Tax=Clostridium botulinum TaxID=1491 RepID=UPI0019680492|nr:hypothetical protein [Clostridium botulinum]MBN1074660.1 hypothetical protein [Clostridium botulinum]
MKELNIIEASNMPVGTEFKMIRNGVEMPNRVYIDNDSRCLRWVSGIKEELSVFKDNLNAKFIPIQKPVSFMEAIADAKNMVKVILDKQYYTEPNVKLFGEYMSISEMLIKLGKNLTCFGISKAINKGKWYIKQD